MSNKSNGHRYRESSKRSSHLAPDLAPALEFMVALESIRLCEETVVGFADDASTLEFSGGEKTWCPFTQILFTAAQSTQASGARLFLWLSQRYYSL